MSVIAAGTPAPSFTLARADGESFTERDLHGQPTVLVFYPFAFSPVCTDQLQLYEDVRRDLERQGGHLYGVSCDSTWAQSAFRDKLGVDSEQLSDFEPKGAACAAFGVLHPGGFPQRALVITDADGVVRWSYEAPSPGELPGVDSCAKALPARSAPEGAANWGPSRVVRPRAPRASAKGAANWGPSRVVRPRAPRASALSSPSSELRN